jgi:hypothetical protein
VTAVRFPDGQTAGRDLIRALLVGRPEPEAAGVVVDTVVPGATSDDLPGLPYVLVRLDGASRTARLDGTALLRVTVYHRDEGLALDLAGLIEALVLDAHTATVRSTEPYASPIPTEDPDTGDPVAFLRFTAHLRPLTI